MNNKTIKRITGCLSLLLLQPMMLYAVEFSVIIKEKGTGAPVEGATVVLMETEQYDSSSSAGRVTFTDVEIPKRIKVIATGYQAGEFVTDKDKSQFVFYVEPVSVEGDGMEVIADRIVEKVAKVKLSNTELIGAAGSGGDPLRAIAALPGVISAGEDSAEVYIRGSDSRENITWVNGVPVGYLYHFGGMFSTINPSLIEDINVFLGGFPVEYGDALGGVIDAKLRAPRNDRMHYKFDLSTISGAFLVEGPVSKNSKDSFFVAGRRSYFDLILSPEKATDLFADDDEDDPDKVVQVPRFYDLQASYRHQINNGYVDAFYYGAGDQIKLELIESAESDPQLAGALSVDQSFHSAGVSWNKRLNAKLSTTGSLAYVTASDSTQVGRDDNGEPFFISVDENSLYFRPEVHWTAHRDSTITAGTTAQYIEVPVKAYISRPNTENDPNFDLTSSKKYRLDSNFNGAEFSPYIKHRQQWNDNVTTTLGLGFTNIRLKGGFETHDLSPRASVEYSLFSNTLLTASWGRYLQLPDGSELIEKFGNPKLVMTEAEHRILGVEHQFNSLYHLKAEVYHKPMKNLVIAIDDNAPPDLYQNKGTGEAYGFDIFLKRAARNKKFGWLALSWAKSRRTNELTGVTRDFSGDQPLTVTALWGQAFPGSWSRWDWSIKAQAHSGTPYTQVVGRHQEDGNDPESRWIAEYGKHNAARLPNYYKLDVRISRNILFNESKMKVYLDIQNATFNNNVVEYDYGTNYEDIDNPSEVTGLSFFPFIGVEMEFY